jgi:hypothetical protein
MRRIIAYCYHLDNFITFYLSQRSDRIKQLPLYFVLNLPRFCENVQKFKIKSSKTSKLKATSNLKSKHTTFNLKLQTSKLKHPTSNRNWNPFLCHSFFLSLLYLPSSWFNFRMETKMLLTDALEWSFNWWMSWKLILK